MGKSTNDIISLNDNILDLYKKNSKVYKIPIGYLERSEEFKNALILRHFSFFGSIFYH